MIELLKSNTRDAYLVRYANNKVHIGEIFKEVDGFYVFEFSLKRQLVGVFNQRFFKVMSDKLYELNKDWEEELSKNL